MIGDHKRTMLRVEPVVQASTGNSHIDDGSAGQDRAHLLHPPGDGAASPLRVLGAVRRPELARDLLDVGKQPIVDVEQ